MCRKHESVYLFRDPPEGDDGVSPEFTPRGYGYHVKCARCGLVGGVTSFGNMRWYTLGQGRPPEPRDDAGEGGRLERRVDATEKAEVTRANP